MDTVNETQVLIEIDEVLIAQQEADLPTSDWPQLNKDMETSVVVPVELKLSNNWRFTCQSWDDVPLAVEKAKNNQDPYQAWLDADLVDGELKLRSKKTVDRFQPLGMSDHSIKMSDYFVNNKLVFRSVLFKEIRFI